MTLTVRYEYPEAVVIRLVRMFLGCLALLCSKSRRMTTFHNSPNKDQYERVFSGHHFTSVIDETLDDVQNWSKSVLLWNIALNPNTDSSMGGVAPARYGPDHQSTHAITYTELLSAWSGQQVRDARCLTLARRQEVAASNAASPS